MTTGVSIDDVNFQYFDVEASSLLRSLVVVGCFDALDVWDKRSLRGGRSGEDDSITKASRLLVCREGDVKALCEAIMPRT